MPMTAQVSRSSRQTLSRWALSATRRPAVCSGTSRKARSRSLGSPGKANLGDLIIFGTEEAITHVALAWDD